nr:hypothetical protein Iba_chr03bCG3010 [Ipomoea batatas]
MILFTEPAEKRISDCIDQVYHGVYEHTLLFLLFDFEWYAWIVGLKKQVQIGNVKGMVEEKEASDPQILEVKVRPENLKLDDGIKNIKMCHQKIDAFGEDGANNNSGLPGGDKDYPNGKGQLHQVRTQNATSFEQPKNDAIFVLENPTNTCNELSPENSNTYPTSKLFMEYLLRDHKFFQPLILDFHA